MIRAFKTSVELLNRIQNFQNDFLYISYWTHQEQLAPILKVMANYSMYKRTDPGSSFFVEVYSKESIPKKIHLYYVKNEGELLFSSVRP